MVNTIIKKQVNPGIHVAAVARRGVKELYITVYPDAGEELSSMLDRLNYSLKEHNANVVKFDVFGSLDKFTLENVDWPVTWVEGNGCSGSSVAGIQVHAVSGVKVKTVFFETKPIARVFEDDFTKYCILGNILPDISSASREVTIKEYL